jgi:hypothetical protein
MSILRRMKVKNPMLLRTCKAVHCRKHESHYRGRGSARRHRSWYALSQSDSLSYHLTEMCEAASLRVISSRRVEIPMGNYCDSFTGIDGTSLSKFKAVSIKSNVQVFNTVSIAMMNGGLELANGAVISNEEERRVLMEDVASFISEGGSTGFFECVVEWPFES